MDTAGASLQPILILLAAAVLAVVACRLLALPPIIGYLAVGLALGPRALGAVHDDAQTRHLAEFGVVFLMFSIGLEFSLSKLRVMRREVFGLGSAQVAITMAPCVALALIIAGSGSWQAGLPHGGGVGGGGWRGGAGRRCPRQRSSRACSPSGSNSTRRTAARSWACCCSRTSPSCR